MVMKALQLFNTKEKFNNKKKLYEKIEMKSIFRNSNKKRRKIKKTTCNPFQQNNDKIET